MAAGALGDEGCCGRGAGSRATGLRDARAALPDAHSQHRGVASGEHLYKLHVCALGKERVAFDERAYFVESHLAEVFAEEYHVGIAHADVGAAPRLAVHLQFDARQVARGRADLFAVLEERLAHIHGDGFGMVNAANVLDARESFEGDGRTVCQSVLIDKAAYAAAAVATHHGLRTIGIEDAHTEVGHLAAADQNQAVGTDARVRTAPTESTLGRIGDGEAVGVDVDVVIAEPFHFGKFYHF